MIALTETDLEQVLGRPVRRLLSAADRRAFADRRVLITGAAGSIGSELARHVARCHPARLALLDQSELGLFTLERELRQQHPGLELDIVLADVAHTALTPLFRAVRPDVVYHAAAYKHVTMVERALCPAVDANVFGSMAAVEAAREVGARFVLISSDKAAAPRSVMGATKRLAELSVLARAGRVFQPIVVRFGNVLGSSGSVLHLMREAIRAGRPVPITDPEATRYFMAAAEAVSLVMKATLLSRRAETYWLDMGAPVRLGDLAARVLALEARAGHAPTPLVTIGLRAGEKLREELTTQGLRMCPTEHARIFVARQALGDTRAIRRAERQLTGMLARGDAAGALAVLEQTVPEFVASDEAWTYARTMSLHAHKPARAAVRVG